jgi:hypothetical protein
MKKVVLFLSIAVVAFGLISPAWAENSDEVEALKKQLQDLQSVVESQQQQIQQQDLKIQQQDRKLQDIEQLRAPAPETYANLDEIVAKVQEKLPAGGDGFTLGGGKIHVTPYGFIRLDMAYDDSETFFGAGNVIAWVWPEDSDNPAFPYEDDDSTFTTTATATRLGLNFDGPQFAGGNVLGKIEIDFDEASGSDIGGAVTAHRIRMRHAWAELKYPTWSVMFGQNWDIVAPRIPNMLDCMVLWGSGNVGYRRPQLRLTKWYDMNGTLFTGQVSLNHADRSATDNTDSDFNILDGEESGWPLGEARLGVDTTVLGGRKFGVGVSGALGDDQSDFPITGNPEENRDFVIWLVALDGSIQVIPDLVTLQGEIWTGDNVNVFMGDIFQGIIKVKDATGAVVDLQTAQSMGGFLSAAITPRKGLLFNVGYGVDDPDNEDLVATMRDRNETIFGNVIWTVVPNVDVGLELAWHKTNWLDLEDGDDLRIQSAFTYKF